MFRRLLAMLTMLCLLAAPALADVYDDHGWPAEWRDYWAYPGFYMAIQQDYRTQIKLPDGWTELGYSGSVAGYESEDGRMDMSVSWIDENAWEFQSRVEDLPDTHYWQYVMTDGDVECMIGVGNNYVECICPTADHESTLILEFRFSNMGEDFLLARQIIASLRVL